MLYVFLNRLFLVLQEMNFFSTRLLFIKWKKKKKLNIKKIYVME
jgi:hypothetical protein